MKCCVLSGSAVRLGIVLLSPHSPALGPGHAAAERHLGGFPLRCAFIYQGFLLPWDWGCWDTSAAQPRAKRKHPFLLPPVPPLSSCLTVGNNTRCTECTIPLVWSPDSLLCLSASSPSCPPPPLAKEHMQMTVMAIGKSWPYRVLTQDEWKKLLSLVGKTLASIHRTKATLFIEHIS